MHGALDRGHQVTALIRERAKVAVSGSIPAAVRIVAGDALDARAVLATVAGQDAVLFALGPRTLAANPLLERAGTHVVQAMRQARASRLIVLGASGALRDGGKHLSPVSRLGFAVFKATLLRNPMLMQARLQRIVENSGLDYTMVLPPRLLDGPPVGTYRVFPDGLPPNGLLLNRADLAEFMLECLDRSTYVGQTPYIAH